MKTQRNCEECGKLIEFEKLGGGGFQVITRISEEKVFILYLHSRFEGDCFDRFQNRIREENWNAT